MGTCGGRALVGTHNKARACCLCCTAAAHTCPSHPTQPVHSCLQLPAAEFAYSMGLPTAPKLRFLKKAGGAAHICTAAQQAGLGRQAQG